ncbi:hypothetical protein [Paracoccus sp. ME4]|uniref:hypothetical protein n=1 Tax=Paracoccus sp. ME4 TaxID=3138066 RepID=UPI00398B6A77
MPWLEAWHGTRASFDRFDAGFLGTASGSINCTGFFFTLDRAVAADYALAEGACEDPFGGPGVPALLRCRVLIDNPADLRIDGAVGTGQLALLQRLCVNEGRDALILRGLEDSPTLLRRSDHLVVFDADRVRIIERLDGVAALAILSQARANEPRFEPEMDLDWCVS